MFVTDCDGVLTDSGMYYFDNGIEAKKFNTRDGVAFSILKSKGIIVGIITGENTQIVKNRANKLKTDFVILGSTNKAKDLENICKEYNVSLENVVYVGDDINDISVMKIVGFSACPKDAIKEVRKIADYKSSKKGGYGVVRDIVNKFIKENLNEK